MENLKTILFNREQSVAVITINQPESMNALNSDVLTEISYVLDEVEADETLKVLVITGSGEKAFVAGANIKDFVEMDTNAGYAFSKLGNDVFYKLSTLRQPTIAAVNGYALGGGNELALACDIRIASENAIFGQPEVGLGISPGFGGTQRLPRLINPSIAKELIYSGRNVKSGEAKEIGLVNRVVPQANLMEEVLKLAQQIAENAPLAVEKSKELINQGLDLPLKHGISMETQAFGLFFGTEDQKAGAKAFVSKEKAIFERQ